MCFPGSVDWLRLQAIDQPVIKQATDTICAGVIVHSAPLASTMSAQSAGSCLTSSPTVPGPDTEAQQRPTCSTGTATIDSALDFPIVGTADVAVFWDFENVRIPAWCPATTASERIRNKVVKFGRIVEKRLYYDSRQPAESSAPRSDLDLSGFTLVDCPTRNRKETLDKKLIVDVLCFAWERASRGATACVVLITSDGDYSYALARLRDIGVFTIVVYRPDVVAKVLIDNANVVMSWEFDVLGGPPRHGDDEDEEGSSATENTIFRASSEANTGEEVSVSESEEASHDNEESTKDPAAQRIVVKQPNVQTRGKFALFFSVLLNAQYRNVKQGISVYSSWADEALTASTFYEKVGSKDREGYVQIRTLASLKGFIEWGRRHLSAPGRPVIRVKDRNERADNLSPNTFLRLTYAGLAVLKPNTPASSDGWSVVLPKVNTPRRLRNESSASEEQDSSSAKRSSSTWKNGKLFVGGLAWQTTEDSLRSYFKQFGPLDTVLVMEGRGFGFVFFKRHDDAECVMTRVGQHFVDHKSVE